MNVTRTSAGIALLVAGVLAQAAPGQKIERIVALGEFLFSSKALSTGRSTSCATCHDPAKGFADGKADAEGELRIGTGRNSPTLFAIGAVAKFRDPRQPQTAKPGVTPRVLTLEDRCLEPLENELEMAGSTDGAIAALRKTDEMTRRFDEAFGGNGGVTKSRLGRALAAFLRTIEPAKAPYAAHLAGKPGALSPAQARGLRVFETHGCSECHSGPALSDGMMHVVDPPWGQRMLDRQRTASERRIVLLRREYARHKTADDVARMSIDAMAKEAKLRANALPGGGGYDADQIEVQTTTLWDVKNTAPYFRDGSVKNLREAVRTHLQEMRTVRDNEPRVKKDLATLDRVGKRSPPPLRAAPRPSAARSADLDPSEFSDLIEFLNALSPG